MMWAVVYIIGAGAYCWFALRWMLRQFGPKPDQVSQGTAVACTLLTCVFWPFFALVALTVAAGGEY